MQHKSSLKDTLAGTYREVEEKIEDFVYDRWHIRLHKKFRRHIHKLRKRPDHHKDIISFSVAFIVTACVFVGWYFISFPNIINEYKINQKENTALNKSANPIEDIKSRITNTDGATNNVIYDTSNNIQTQ